ncbi:MAG: peptidase M22 [Clostridiales bacterium]|jgi:N6-L-threonylcarbamoyladenine synthase|nr:peptidase M22 [Clostridiales bacterium]
MPRFLGIDTSNYTTSVSVVDNGEVVLNLKSPLKVRQGQLGLRQSDAVFYHISNLPELMERLSASEPVKNYSAVGCSARPRDAEGSYMPCFLAGVAAAHSAAAVLGVPVFEFSHQAGHIAAAVFSSGGSLFDSEKFLAFHVSGGTTELLLCKGRSFMCEIIGGTKDLNAGQAIDRIGVMLGLDFPCGPALEKMADEYLGTLKNGEKPHDKPEISVDGTECNLSGLENIAERMKRRCEPDGKTALFTIDFIRDTLDRMTENALALYPGLPLLYAGGVMSNRRIREYFEAKYGALFAEPEYSSDNAAGIALLASRKWDELND